VRAGRSILLVTYKYLKTDARVRSNRVFSPNYFVAARGKSKNPVASRLAAVAGCISAKTLEGKVAAEYQEAGAILQGLLTLKSTKKQSRTHQPGLRYENTLSQPLNRVKKTGFFGLECLSPDFFSAYLIFAANNKIYFCNKI